MILDLIKDNVERNPDRCAIRSRGFEPLSYIELWNLSERLGIYLDARLGDNRKPLVVYGHKSPIMLISFLACVRSGRAYVPVDKSMPMDRIRDIVGAVANDIMLIAEPQDDYETLLKQLQETDCEPIIAETILNGFRHLSIEEEIEELSCDFPDVSLRKPLTGLKPEDIFYIIFTSGSTGKPKGVTISNRALTNYVNWSGNLAYNNADKDGRVFLNQAPFSFDLSVMDTYTSLAWGGTIVTVDKELQSDVEGLISYIKENGIEYFVSTPSFCQMCTADKSFNGEEIPSLRAFLFCGERLSKDLAGELLKRFPKAKVINTYGPTESTVALTEVEIKSEHLESSEELPIGRVKLGSSIVICDENLRPLEEGQHGELLIGGDTLSSGYFMDEEKTAKAFLKLNLTGEEELFYRTGDEGYYKGDELYYIGRLDLQIKLHGYRIELGDIEANIMALEEIRNAVVVPKRRDGEIKYMVAFVCSNMLEGTYEDRKNIRQRLSERLPDYMVPKTIKFIDEIPMTPNGKADRKKLESRI